jgi:hypothetical protein
VSIWSAATQFSSGSSFEGSDLSAIDHLIWRETAVFYALRHPDLSIVQTVIDAKMGIGMDQ